MERLLCLVVPATLSLLVPARPVQAWVWSPCKCGCGLLASVGVVSLQARVALVWRE